MEAYLSLVFTQVDDYNGEITTRIGLLTLLDNIFDSLKKDEAVVLMVKKSCTLVCTRKRGHGDRVLKKFVNFGFGAGESSKTEGLETAIRALTENLPDYCYQAIRGDKAALRLTTQHLLKVYRKKAERMIAKKKPTKEVKRIEARIKEIETYLEANDEELSDLIDMLVIEIPKDKSYYSSIDELELAAIH